MFEFVKLNKLLLLFLILTPHFAFSAFETCGNNVSNLALAGAGCAAAEYRLAGTVNPAYSVCDNSFTLSYRRLFGLPELQHTSLSYNHSLKKFNLAGELYYFGFSQYRENAFSLLAAYPLYSRLHLGGKISLYNLAISGYGSASTVTFSLGAVYKLLDNLSFGFSPGNIPGFPANHLQSQLPAAFIFGAAYRPHPQLQILLDYHRENRFPAELKCGLEYILLEKIVLRAGISSETNIFACGTDLLFRRGKFSYAFRNHPYLGIEQTMGVSLSFPR